MSFFKKSGQFLNSITEEHQQSLEGIHEDHESICELLQSHFTEYLYESRMFTKNKKPT